ncbi:MAG: hypothetical protein NTX72_03520 [Candidatus Uhrbacteria bacterium]|nr:hypothetical protein [Candidatus Uhrbacteria bacterium]
MMRFFPHLLAALVLSTVETSFFGSLHGMFRFTPFVLVVSVYLVQHHAMKPAVSWMVIHGLLLDLSGITIVPFITIAYIVTAWVALLSAERLFSNRSFYGVAACTLLSYLSFEVVSGLLQLISTVIQKNTFYWGTYFSDAGSRFITLFVALIVLYSFAKQIRYLLVKLYLVPPSRQTY